VAARTSAVVGNRRGRRRAGHHPWVSRTSSRPTAPILDILDLYCPMLPRFSKFRHHSGQRSGAQAATARDGDRLERDAFSPAGLVDDVRFGVIR
jgi:hypothetical protein